MTPEEFKQHYQVSQERIGNHLQTLTDLSEELNYLIEQVSQDYNKLNATTEAFLREQEKPDSPEVQL